MLTDFYDVYWYNRGQQVNILLFHHVNNTRAAVYFVLIELPGPDELFISVFQEKSAEIYLH